LTFPYISYHPPFHTVPTTDAVTVASINGTTQKEKQQLA